MDQEIFYTMALTRLTNFNYQQALGSPEGLERADETGRSRNPLYGRASHSGFDFDQR